MCVLFCGLKSFGQNMHANQFSSSFLLSVEAKRKGVCLWVKKEVLSMATKAVEEKMTHTKGKKEGDKIGDWHQWLLLLLRSVGDGKVGKESK